MDTTLSAYIQYPRLIASVEVLVADYKARGIERSAAYSQFVIDRALRPEMNAKEFFIIWDRGASCLLPTRHQQATGQLVTIQYTQEYGEWPSREAVITSRGEYRIVWIDKNGTSGSDPLSLIMNIVSSSGGTYGE